MSDMSQLSEERSTRRDLQRGRMPGESAAGNETAAEEQQTVGLGRWRPRHVQKGPLLAWGRLQLGWGFSQSLNWVDVKV